METAPEGLFGAREASQVVHRGSSRFELAYFCSNRVPEKKVKISTAAPPTIDGEITAALFQQISRNFAHPHAKARHRRRANSLRRLALSERDFMQLGKPHSIAHGSLLAILHVKA